MDVLSPKYPGLFFICEQCGALCANVQENEIYEDNTVYCAVCHFRNFLPYYKKYDGIVQENKNNV